MALVALSLHPQRDRLDLFNSARHKPMTPPATPSLPARHVFVYGTLRKGGSNDITRLVPAPVWVGTAQVLGRMFDLGAYPGLILGAAQGQCAAVQGEVYAITPALERVLDEIEEVFPQATGEYAKLVVDVCVAGAAWPCIVYEINPARTAGKPQITSGDWFQRG